MKMASAQGSRARDEHGFAIRGNEHDMAKKREEDRAWWDVREKGERDGRVCSTR